MDRAPARLAALTAALLAFAAAAARSQAPPPDILRRAERAHDAALRLGREMPDSLWPGFRPDTIPVIYVVPGQGGLLLGWRGPLPEGYAAVPGSTAGWQAAANRGAASTGTTLGGRGTAQVVVRAETLADLVGLTLHEAFHVHASAVRAPQRRFGRGENSFLVASYPVFDPDNEAGMALEGRILAAALETADRGRRRELARWFVAAREARHRRLGPSLAEFEQLAELNEGLAEYQMIRSVALLERTPSFEDAGGAGRIRAALPGALRRLTQDVTQSLRLRYYRLGPAQALLLDRLEGPGWKRRVLDRDLTLQDALAEAAGARDAERALIARGAGDFGGAALRRSADIAVARLRAVRQRQVDSVLAVPGLRLIVLLDSLPGRSVGWCGIDPQNLLRVDDSRLLHTRWVRPCRGSQFQAVFNTPLLQDDRAGRLEAVIRTADSLRVLADGRVVPVEPGRPPADLTGLELLSPDLELRAARAELWRDGPALYLRLKP